MDIWDSAGNGFTPYGFGAFGPRSTMIALGGGYEATLMSWLSLIALLNNVR
ncbi:hypothetical protein [Dyella monticola]|uniref:hypothetical protein n=1 Tax=Dyella monticola TaxID=1927958 RepID=UPI001313D965|nr:hypothetical protein [Dyella monticola]